MLSNSKRFKKIRYNVEEEEEIQRSIFSEKQDKIIQASC